VENLDDASNVQQVTLPLVLRVTREKAADVRRSNDRVFKMFVFALFTALIISVVLAMVLIAEDEATRLIILGIAAAIGVVDFFLIKLIKKQRQNALLMLASDGATVLVVDQYGITIGDRVIPRERITAVIYRLMPASGNTSRPVTRSYEAVIGLDQISALRPGGLAITPRAGSGGEAGSVSFPFKHFLTNDDLPPFLAAAQQISRGYFPVTEISQGGWDAMQRDLGQTRDQIKRTAHRHSVVDR